MEFLAKKRWNRKISNSILGKWALKINLDYRPGILLYDNKKLISTVDALLYPFHFKELLRYVGEKHYKKYPKSKEKMILHPDRGFVWEDRILCKRNNGSSQI